jgi:hypothetical protein
MDSISDSNSCCDSQSPTSDGDSVTRIAMWSGPRNISTAMMRSWGNRPDTAVWDEPFYAHYLQQTGRRHPGRDETLARHEIDWRKVRDRLLGDIPGGKPIFYQKQMAHHFLEHIDRQWLRRVVNCFLIRDPAEMLASLVKKVPDARLEDTGLPQQVEIFQLVQDWTGQVPVVIDARDVLENPPAMLQLLCSKLGLAFAEEMLSWPPGSRETDGAWAPYWYAEVEKSTTFQPYHPVRTPVLAELRELLKQCQEYYEQLHEHRLKV